MLAACLTEHAVRFSSNDCPMGPTLHVKRGPYAGDIRLKIRLTEEKRCDGIKKVLANIIGAAL